MEKVCFPKGISLIIEPGRYLVAESGLLITKVTNKRNIENNCLIGCDSGMNHLIRPALYKSFHNIYNFHKRYNFFENIVESISANEENKNVLLFGNICESGDYFIKDIVFKNFSIEIGDALIILNVGAYVIQWLLIIILGVCPTRYYLKIMNS